LAAPDDLASTSMEDVNGDGGVIQSEQETSRSARRRRDAGHSSTPQRASELAHLSLDALRAYRQELLTEETRVSYWRRILQARLDLGVAPDRIELARLKDVLAEHVADSRRLSVLSLLPPDDVPPVPDLAVLWELPTFERGGLSGDVLTRLAAAERELSTYRRSLHRRLDTVTEDLIARYHADPQLALSALPHRQTGPEPRSPS
jgi:hypothetical protein